MPRIIKKTKKEEVVEPVIEALEPTEVVPAVDPNKCTACHGSGRQNAEDLCVLCQGRGRTL